MTPPVEDVTRELGYLTLGTRLKRIGERLQADTQRILDAHELAVSAAQFPFLAAIDRLGPLTVGQLAEAVGVTQPAATKAVAQLAEAGLLDVAQSAEDLRKKSIDLSKQGKKVVAEGKRKVWPLIEAAVKELCGPGPLLEQLATIEEGLDARPLDRRAAAIRSRRA